MKDRIWFEFPMIGDNEIAWNFCDIFKTRGGWDVVDLFNNEVISRESLEEAMKEWMIKIRKKFDNNDVNNYLFELALNEVKDLCEECVNAYKEKVF